MQDALYRLYTIAKQAWAKTKDPEVREQLCKKGIIKFKESVTYFVTGKQKNLTLENKTNRIKLNRHTNNWFDLPGVAGHLDVPSKLGP